MKVFTCPCCQSRRLAMGMSVSDNKVYCIRCEDCTFTQNFFSDSGFSRDEDTLWFFATTLFF